MLVLPNNYGAFASEIRDIAISFTQPDVSSRSSIAQFPAAIYAKTPLVPELSAS